LRGGGVAATGRVAIDLVRTTELDVLVMDLSMPGQSGIDALGMIRAKAPDVGILILSGYPEAHYAMNLIRQGASGYLNKECEPMEIVNAIRTISLGRRYISPAVADELHLDADTEGVVVLEPGDGTTAANVGFQKGDVIMAVNNQKIAKTVDLDKASRESARIWRITVLRGGQQINVTLGG
ncbi:response regulator, partial [Bradyrhizobium sp.]|uniref:response regulator n=1 Tax=Bradyrhizobium sp. TaxID=376 RepID=UPI003919B34B